jgi:hypothetical protein
VVLKGLEAGEGGTSGDELVAEAGLVLIEVVILVDLLVAVLVVVWEIGVSMLSLFRQVEDNIPQKPMVKMCELSI